jgi:2-dehydro-3-deoxy-D-arabinonate dehydratase
VVTFGADRVTPVDPRTLELPAPYELLLPVEPPEVWCAGVTYERSRDARIEESGSDVYAKVYDAERPELFLKDADCRRTVGPGKPIGVRSDSQWNVPEAEIGLVLGERGAILGYTIGNDVSSRDIEGANPLYLPQAKIYDDALGLSGTIVLARDGADPRSAAIELEIHRDGERIFAGDTSVSEMKRSFEELVAALFQELSFPAGAVLLTGTGVVPPDEITLRDGDRVRIVVEGVGVLEHDIYRRSG